MSGVRKTRHRLNKRVMNYFSGGEGHGIGCAPLQTQCRAVLAGFAAVAGADTGQSVASAEQSLSAPWSQLFYRGRWDGRKAGT
jgi:hypothetical protein